MPLPPVWRCELDCKRLVGLVWLALGLAVVQGADQPTPEGEDFFVTAPGFRQAGEPLTAAGDQTRTLRILVSDEATGRPSRCRINVIGPDGNYYHPPENPLSLYSFTGEWPNGKAKGNRREKAPYRYLGRFFYSTGESELAVPPGEYRIEVSKGFEHKPLVSQARVAKGKSSTVRVALSRTAAMSAERYFGGDLHLHLLRATDRDDETIFDLLEAEDIAYGTPLGYNEPAGPYSGFMEKLDYPQFRGLGEASIKSRGPITILSGQEYRSGQYGHLNLYLRDRLVLEGKSFNADDWPVYGLVGAETQAQGGFAIHAHGGYALELYADAALGTVNAVELLQFGVYRGIGLADWYHMLNSGYRFPCVGASDYPACRFLGDCRTYVRSELPKSSEDRPAFADWLKGASEGRSFVTTGPLLQLDVDGHAPGEIIEQAGPEPRTVTVRIRVRSEVTPVSHVDLVVNGSVQQSGEIPAAKRQGAWHTVTHQVALRDSSWIAARAWSTTPGGQPDAESHTNPVYVYRNGKKPYQQASLDAWVQRIDGQIEKHSQRKFAEKSKVLDYFQRARDLLLKIRQKGGLGIDDDPAQLAADMERDDPPALAADIARPDATDEELREFLKPVPATPPEEAVKAFEGIDGFHMELVAAEPLVYDPIAAAFDEDGNLYACEMRDYPYKPADGLDPIGSVRFLRDTDGDGRYDEAHVFADKLLWAAGVVPWKGGVFVAAPPDIWYFKDTDGDHVADVKRRVFTGFGTGNQQAMVNNLQMGMDHWIYGSTAGNGGLIRPGDQPDAPPVSVSGRDFRFDPVTEKFELVTGTIQFGNTFDDWGNRFVCSESQPLLQIVLPDHYLARNPFLPSPYGIQSLAPYPVPIFRISPIERWRQIRSSRRIAKNERAAASAGASHHVVDAAAGVMVYRGGAYPSEFYGQVFVGDGQNNLIHRRALVPDGVPFKSLRVDQQTEFIRTPDIWFRPVNLVNAPDGTLYCCDMSREVLESIHVPLDVVRHLDLKSGRNTGRIYRIAPPGFKSPPPPRLSHATTAQLLAALESPHGWWRDTAQRLLYERQDRSAAAALRRVARESSLPQARLLAAWSLQGLGELDDATRLALLGDEHAGVRENGVRLAESRLGAHPQLLARVAQLADDENPRIRFQVAFSLGESTAPESVAALARLARRDGADPWIRTAVLSSVAQSADRMLIELLQIPTDQAPAVAGMLGQLAQVVGVRNQPQEVAATLDTLAKLQATGRSGDAQRLLFELGTGMKRSGAGLAALQTTGPGADFLRDALTRGAQIASRADAPLEQKIAAVGLLSCAPSPRHRELLGGLLAIEQPEPLQLAAIKALADDPDPQVGALLLERWASFVPEIRRAALGALLSREEGTRRLLEAALRDDVSVADVEPTRREMLVKHKNETIRRLAGKVFGAAGPGPRKGIVDEYQAALKLRGDLANGGLVFEKNCAACHQLAGKGFNIGPNLASSPSRDPGALLTHILDPNQYVLPNYLQYVVVDKNGRSYTGLLAAQSATSITLKKEKDEMVTVLRGDIDELTSSNKSLMPEGLEKEISLQGMADLIAYLNDAAAKSPGDPNAERDFGTLPGLVETERSDP